MALAEDAARVRFNFYILPKYALDLRKVAHLLLGTVDVSNYAHRQTFDGAFNLALRVA